MIRQPKQEQLNRLVVKTLDQVFIARAREGLGASLFEALALTDLVKEVYFPWLSQPEAIQAGQLAMSAVSADEPGQTRHVAGEVGPDRQRNRRSTGHPDRRSGDILNR